MEVYMERKGQERGGDAGGERRNNIRNGSIHGKDGREETIFEMKYTWQE